MARKTTQNSRPEDQSKVSTEAKTPSHAPPTEEDIRQPSRLNDDSVAATDQTTSVPSSGDVPASRRAAENAEEKPSSHDPVDREPRTEPANTMGVVGGGDDTRDKGNVRAGPGDAGAQHSPQVRTVGSGDRPRPKPGGIFVWIAIGVAILVALIFFGIL